MSDPGKASVAEVAWREMCGSQRWGRLMQASGPHRRPAQLQAAAARAFDALSREDWLEAFAAHSRIGAPRWGDRTGAGEQTGMADADPQVRAALATANDRYRQRFGFQFLIRARGRSVPEMLAALHERLDNPPEVEFAIARAQQREITALRLAER